MNKHWYTFGNSFKVKFREHYCYKCKVKLPVITHRKVVNYKSDEAQYYDFTSGGPDSVLMVGNCEFIHKVFYCPVCNEQIEFVTQISFEDVDIIINKIQNKFSKKGRTIVIKKSFETVDGKLIDKVEKLENIKKLVLSVCENNEEILNCKFPLLRKNFWERPYYFNISKRKVINLIKKSI